MSLGFKRVDPSWVFHVFFFSDALRRCWFLVLLQEVRAVAERR